MNYTDINTINLAPEQCVTGFGKTLFVAPHADDESLGGGGLISLLRKYGQEVFIILLSDGTLSHPNSLEYYPERLMKTRENELLKAADILGVPSENIIFCRYKDRSVPNKESADFGDAVQSMSKLLNIIKPASIFFPWRKDPHPDHRAAYDLFNSAETLDAKLYEYPIWLQKLGKSEDWPTAEEVTPFRLDISSVLATKQQAIAAHLTQTSDLITDDPDGFRLSEDMLNQFKVNYELFFISK